MVAKSISTLCKFCSNAIVLASVLVFSIRFCIRLPLLLLNSYRRRPRTFTFQRRRRCLRWRKPAEDAPPPYCAVCLHDAAEGEKMMRLTACRHCFHLECIEEWLRLRSTCPLCRSEVPPMPRANQLLLSFFVPSGVIDYIYKNGAIVSDA